jgi:hypothetical protein
LALDAAGVGHRRGRLPGELRDQLRLDRAQVGTRDAGQLDRPARRPYRAGQRGADRDVGLLADSAGPDDQDIGAEFGQLPGHHGHRRLGGHAPQQDGH